jgi:autotransporter translocation and assembly factor TamB
MRQRRDSIEPTGKEGRFKPIARRMLALAGKAALLLTAVLLVASAALWGVLQQEEVRNRILSAALSRVSDQLSGQISAGGIEGDLLTGFRLKQVTVRDREATIFSADALAVRYWLPTLLGGHWLIQSVTLEHGAADLVRGPDGTWNWQRIFRTPSEPSGNTFPREPPAVSIRQLRIVGSAIRVSVAGSGADPRPSVAIQNLDLEARLSIGNRVALSLGRLSFYERQHGFVLKQARGRIGYDPAKKAVFLENLTLATAGSEMTASGAIRLAGEKPFLDLAVDPAAIDLGELARLTRTRALSTGTLAGRLKLSGTLADLSFEAGAGLAAAHLAVQGTAIGLDSERPIIDLTASVSRLDPAALPLRDNAAPPGELNADLTARVVISAPLAEGEALLRFRPSRLAGVEIRSGAVRLEGAGEDLRFEAQELETGYGRFSGKGTVAGLGAGKRPLSVGVALDAEALNPGRILGDDRYGGSLSAALQADIEMPRSLAGLGDPASIQGRVRGLLAPSVLAGVRIDGGRFDLRWDGRRLGISRFDIDAAGAKAAIAGGIGFQDRTVNAELNADTADIGAVLGALRPLFPHLPEPDGIAGAVSIRGRAKGPWARPQVTGRVIGSGLRSAEHRLKELTVDAQWSGSSQDYRTEFRFSADGLRIEGRNIERTRGTVVVRPDSMAISLDGDLADGAGFSADGTVDAWPGPVRRVVVDRLVLSGGPLPIRTQGPVRLAVHPDHIDVERMPLVSDPARLTVSGRFWPDRVEGVKVDFSLLALSRLRRLFPEAPAVAGLAEGAFTVSGKLAAPQIEGHVRIEKGELGGFLSGDFVATVAAIGEQVRIDATLSGPSGERTAVAGRVPVHLSLLPGSVRWSAAAFDLAFSAGNWRLSAVPFIDKAGFTAEGTASVSGNVGGTPFAPVVSADAVVVDGYFPAIDPEAERIGFSALKLNAQVKSGQGTVRATVIRNQNVIAELTAAAPVRFSLEPVSFEAVGDGLDARIVSAGLPLSAIPIATRFGIKADGRLNLDVRAYGKVFNPALHGTLVLEKGRLAFPRYGLSYEEVSARLKLDNRQVTVESLTLAGDVEGWIRFAGRIELADFRPARFDLEVFGDNLLVPYRRTLTARVRPALTVTGPADAPSVSGELTIVESRLNLDRLSDQGPAEIQVVGEIGADADTLVIDPSAGGPSILTPLSADVRVVLPKNSWMRGQGLNAEIGGEVGLRKAAGGPFTLTGGLSALRGVYIFQGKRFAIDEGTVTFVGAEEPNPNLNIRASTRIRDVRITVQISGTARDIRLTLDSDPAMDPAEIISYVVFGRSSEEMKTGKATSAEEAALKMTGALTATQLNEIFGDAFILDSLSIEPGEGGLGEGSVSMGKYVTPEVFVAYRQSFDLKQLHQLEVTYEILPSLDLETVVGDDKGYGIDLFWKRDY